MTVLGPAIGLWLGLGVADRYGVKVADRSEVGHSEVYGDCRPVSVRVRVRVIRTWTGVKVKPQTGVKVKVATIVL